MEASNPACGVEESRVTLPPTEGKYEAPEYQSQLAVKYLVILVSVLFILNFRSICIEGEQIS